MPLRHAWRLLLLCTGLLALPVPPRPAAAQEVDRLAQALEITGMTREDLGCRPRGYWSRFPHIDHIPHLLPFFKDLFAEPLEVYGFTRVMAGALEEHLDPTYRRQYGNAMFKVVHFLGIEKKVVGPRGYDYAADFAVFAAPDSARGGGAPVLAALERLHALTGAPLTPTQRRQLEQRREGLPAALEPAVAHLVDELGQAWRWRGVALAEVDSADLRAVLTSGPPLERNDFQPAVARVGRQLDQVSLYHAGQRLVLAAERAARELEAVLAADPAVGQADFRWDTPVGTVRLAGSGPDRHDATGCAILIDLGGNDVYSGPVGAAAALETPLAVALDLAGDDVYQAAGARCAQGAAILGAGILLDRAGNDRYQAERMAQGAGFFGLGLLWDDAGDDEYALHFSGQGAGYFGVGLLVDGAGQDSYYLWGDGQGFGGYGGGVGVLADGAGDDTYTAEVDAHITNRGSGHSHKRITSSNAQGAGIGRRGDIDDGHAWAGGLGALLDLDGNDTYEAGNWAIGTAYWFATGLLYDGGGNDTYRGVYYSLASGAHFCVSAVIDERGNDQYRLWDPPVADDLVPAGQGMNAAGGAGLAFGWDFTATLLLDKAGDDRYAARMISGGLAMIRSTAILADLGGNDEYILPAGHGGGMASPSRIAYPPAILPSFRIEYSPASNYGSNFGLLLDAGGRDRYLEHQDDGPPRAATVWGDGRTWRQPAPEQEEYEYGSAGLGMDVEGGTVPEYHRFEHREGIQD